MPFYMIIVISMIGVLVLGLIIFGVVFGIMRRRKMKARQKTEQSSSDISIQKLEQTQLHLNHDSPISN